MKPQDKPKNPCFSSGPCAKRPGWSLESLADAALGRSHRSALGLEKLGETIQRSRRLLGVPEDFRVGIVPASDTGAVEAALWSLLGPRGVDVLAWESFGKGWVTDVTKQLRLEDVRVLDAEYGLLPDLGRVDWARDVVFTWNGTTSGVKVPDAEWIAADREGLSVCDATSGVFADEMPWDKIDVLTYSWQKVMGGEAAHGVLVLGPRAVERLESHTPSWPLPKLFRLTKGGKLIEGIFTGDTINTPSMLCVEDALDGLRWAEDIGGLPALIARSRQNLAVLEAWVEGAGWAGFLAADTTTRSSTSVCLKLADPGQAARAKKAVKLLEAEGAAYDIGSYRDAPPGLRIWGGATVEADDLRALTPWLDWAWEECA